MFQVAVLVRRGLLQLTRCQFVLMCVLSEVVVQLSHNIHVQATVMFDVINLVELAFDYVVVDKVLIVTVQ